MRKITFIICFLGINLFIGFLLLSGCSEECENIDSKVSFTEMEVLFYKRDSQTGQDLEVKTGDDTVLWSNLYVRIKFDYLQLSKKNSRNYFGMVYACDPPLPYDLIKDFEVISNVDYNEKEGGSDLSSLFRINYPYRENLSVYFGNGSVETNLNLDMELIQKPDFTTKRNLLFQVVTDLNDTLSFTQEVTIR